MRPPHQVNREKSPRPPKEATLIRGAFNDELPHGLKGFVPQWRERLPLL
jgi:hypothetical protein